MDAFTRADRRLRGRLRVEGSADRRDLPPGRRDGPLGRRRLGAASSTPRSAPASTRRASTSTATTRPTADLRLAIEAGVGRIVCDSFDEISRLDGMLDRPQEVMIRVTPGIKANTHSFIQTGQLDSKFGFGLEDGLAARGIEAIRAREPRARRPPRAHRLADLRARAVREDDRGARARWPRTRASSEDELRLLNVGGGLGIAYEPGDEPPSIESYVDLKVEGRRARLRPGAAHPGRARALAGRQRRRHPLRGRDGEGDPRSQDLRRRRRRHVGQPAPDALRRALRRADRKPRRGGARHARDDRRACTASRATSSSATSRWRRHGSATSSQLRPRVRTVMRWRTTTTACRARP